MVHDFAKIKPEPLLEYRQVEAPPSWMLLFTGLITGVAVGVFACVLFYLSGNVPPLQVASQPRPMANEVVAAVASEPAAPEEEAPAEIQFEFYEELQNNEVIVDATPVTIENAEITIENTAIESPNDGKGFMLQSGAFEQRASADSQLARLEALGLSSVIKQQNLAGRTLYLVQSGPFNTGDQVGNAESLLLRNNIDSIKIILQ